jgi:hypothetical protein
MGFDDSGMHVSFIYRQWTQCDMQNSDRGSFILSHVNQSIPDLTCPALVDFSAQFERPLSPHGFSSPAPIDIPPEVHPFEDSDGWPEEPRMSEPKWLAPPPIFDVASVRVIYFDVYDTLIVRRLHSYRQS